MCDQEPGLFTSTIPAMVIPRKTSRETKRWGWFDTIYPQISLADLATKRRAKCTKENALPAKFVFAPFVPLCGNSFLSGLCWRRGTRAQTKRLRLGQRRSYFVFSQSFIHCAALGQPNGNHLVVAGQDAIQPVRSILRQPLTAIIFFQYREFLGHLAQVVVNRACVISQLSDFRSVAQ